jgi:hypothetical protein
MRHLTCAGKCGSESWRVVGGHFVRAKTGAAQNQPGSANSAMLAFIWTRLAYLGNDQRRNSFSHTGVSMKAPFIVTACCVGLAVSPNATLSDSPAPHLRDQAEVLFNPVDDDLVASKVTYFSRDNRLPGSPIVKVLTRLRLRPTRRVGVWVNRKGSGRSAGSAVAAPMLDRSRR